MELSKSEKKIAREIIEKGLQKEFENGLLQAEAVLKEWREKPMDNREAYHLLFSKIKTFDKHIARRYDGMTGSHYLYVIAAQFYDGVITEDDLAKFPEAVQEAVRFIAGR